MAYGHQFYSGSAASRIKEKGYVPKKYGLPSTKRPIEKLNIEEYKARLDYLKSHLDSIIADAIRTNAGNIANLVRNRLYTLGTDANELQLKRKQMYEDRDKDIKSRYNSSAPDTPHSPNLISDSTVSLDDQYKSLFKSSGKKLNSFGTVASYKNGRSTLRQDHIIDLHSSGNLYASFDVEYINKEIIITTKDWKRQKIINEYGPDAFQLTTKEVDYVYKTFIDPVIQGYFDAFEFKPSKNPFSL